MKNTWFEISLGSLTSLFPDFPSTCLSCQEKLRQHFMSKMSNCEIPSQKPQKPRGTFRLPGRWNEISAFLLAALFLCCPGCVWCGDLWAGSDSFPSQLHVPLPPAAHWKQMCRDGSVMMHSSGLPPFPGSSGGMGCLPGKLEKKPKRI